METKNIMIVGVGGQGSLLASKLLGHLLMEQGYDVKVSEVHGMSQRGGSVVTYVRCGDKVSSPVIDKGEADYIVSFELLEAARWLSYLKPDGQIVTSTQQIDPMPVITGASSYPETWWRKCAPPGPRWMPWTASSWPRRPVPPRRSISSSWAVCPTTSTCPTRPGRSLWRLWCPPKFLELNKKAFELGKKA